MRLIQDDYYRIQLHASEKELAKLLINFGEIYRGICSGEVVVDMPRKRVVDGEGKAFVWCSYPNCGGVFVFLYGEVGRVRDGLAELVNRGRNRVFFRNFKPHNLRVSFFGDKDEFVDLAGRMFGNRVFVREES